MLKQDNRAQVGLDILFLILYLSFLFFTLLGVTPLFVPDEGRYAEIAREMVQSSNYITPYLNGIKYFEKPVLFYWLEAFAIHMGGLNLWALRSVNAILGIVGCLLTYLTVRQLFDRITGLLSALILSTSTLYFAMVHMINLDLSVSVFITACLYFFLLSIHSPKGNAARLYIGLSAASAALGVLSKGLIGIILPALVIGLWILISNKWVVLKRLYLPFAIFIFLIIVLPWHVMVSIHNPEFFHFYFIEQQFLRYTSKGIGHYQPHWFFIPYLILGFFPWIAFLPALLSYIPRYYKQYRNYSIHVFLCIWTISIFLFFSFSKSKLIPYILPMLPALSILTALYLRKTIDKTRILSLRFSFLFLFILSLIIAITYFWFIQKGMIPDPKTAQFYLSFAAISLLIGILVANITVYYRPFLTFPILILTITTFLLSSLAALPSIDTRTIQPLANKLKPLLNPQDEVITYNQYYQDLPFYLERRVSILNWKNELSFGMNHMDTNDWMIDDATFWKRFNDPQKKVYVIMAKDNYERFKTKVPPQKIKIIDQTLTNVLISNH